MRSDYRTRAPVIVVISGLIVYKRYCTVYISFLDSDRYCNISNALLILTVSVYHS